MWLPVAAFAALVAATCARHFFCPRTGERAEWAAGTESAPLLAPSLSHVTVI